MPETSWYSRNRPVQLNIWNVMIQDCFCTSSVIGTTNSSGTDEYNTIFTLLHMAY